MYLIFGLGRSGKSFQKYCDKRSMPYHLHQDGMDEAMIPWNQIKCVMQSPGIPLKHPLTQKALNKGIKVTTDIDLFIQQLPEGAITIGITGTNGKSTTTALLNHILNESGKKAVMGGNIGIPVFDLPFDQDIYIFELSSYQLELSPNLPLSIAGILNMTPDHLSRHGSFEQYLKEKKAIANKAEKFFINGNDPHLRGLSKDIFNAQDIDFVLPASLMGEHNKENAAFCYKVSRALDLSKKDFMTALENFKGLPHRQEIVPVNRKGWTVINDSKATNVISSQKALEAYGDEKKLYWIAGGQLKEGDDLSILDSASQNVKRAAFFGASGKQFSEGFSNIEHAVFETLQESIDWIKRQEPGTILFSPACPSFDQFKNFEERGETFKKLILLHPE